MTKQTAGLLAICLCGAMSIGLTLPSSAATRNFRAIQSTDDTTVQEALNLIRDGSIEQGFLILDRLAGQGNANSLFHIGEMFRLGIGREKNNSIAVMYFRLANALGHVRASLSLANLLFFEGDGSEKQLAEALSIWQERALDGDLESMYVLGMIYWNGEAGLPQDPVRGYGLVWRAAKDGYKDAIQNELTMRSILNAEARQAAQDYGDSLNAQGFGSDPMALDLVKVEAVETQATGSDVAVTVQTEDTAQDTASQTGATPTEVAPENGDDQTAKEAPLSKPEDWSSVWRLEVGFAMSELEVKRLQSIINSTQQETVGRLFSDIQPSVTRPGLYRLVYGPLKGMHQAVNTCVVLKRAGHDCSAKSPE